MHEALAHMPSEMRARTLWAVVSISGTPERRRGRAGNQGRSNPYRRSHAGHGDREGNHRVGSGVASPLRHSTGPSKGPIGGAWSRDERTGRRSGASSARLLARHEDEDEALRWLRRGADERSTFVVHLCWDARFGGLRQDPRYRELMVERLALPAPVPAV